MSTRRRTASGTVTCLAAAALVAGALWPAQVRAQNPAAMAEGARVYASQCGRCHNPRSPTERTDRQWRTIVAHMRARANLTRSQAEAVLVFLQMTNTPEIPVTDGTDGEAESPRTARSEEEPGEARPDGVPSEGGGAQAGGDATAGAADDPPETPPGVRGPRPLLSSWQIGVLGLTPEQVRTLEESFRGPDPSPGG